MKWRAAVGWCSAVALAIVFVAAAVPKILEPRSFALMVFRYQILPYALINMVAIYLPWVELSTAMGLLWPGKPRQAAALVALTLLVIFVGALIFNLARGINVACGCFSVDPDARPDTVVSVVRDTGLIVLAALTWWFSWEPADLSASNRR